MNKLSLFMERIENSYGIPIGFKFLDGKKQTLPCPVVSGTELYVGAKAPHMPHMEEAFGYSFEMFVLYAWYIGIGTVRKISIGGISSPEVRWRCRRSSGHQQ